MSRVGSKNKKPTRSGGWAMVDFTENPGASIELYFPGANKQIPHYCGLRQRDVN